VESRFREKKDVKIEGGLFRKRKGTSLRGFGDKREYGNVYDQSTLYTCMKMS
jgi:hypothetical protein